MDIIRIVITGGCCGGKTELMDKLEEELEHQAILVREVSTKVLMERKALETSDNLEPGKVTQEGQNGHQGRVYARQLKERAKAEEEAKARGIRFIIFEKVELCGAAYLKDGVAEMTARFGIDQQQIFRDYTLVVHLVTTALIDGVEYDMTANNPYRLETKPEAIKVEHATRAVWEGHPNRKIITGNGNLSSKLDEARHHIMSLISPA